MKPLLQSVLFLLTILSLMSCENGYRQVDGQWSYVTIDEGHGRRVQPLEVDPETFEILSQRAFAKDKDQVFYQGLVLPGVDAPSYRLLPSGIFTADKDRIYFLHLPIGQADPATFEEIGYPYAKDKNFIYCGSIPIAPNQGQRLKVVRRSKGYSIATLESFLRDNEPIAHLDTTGVTTVAYGYGEIRINGDRYVDFRKLE
ncbi:DKNYY domain-containing protein [Flavilitoribacter nigricans]|nr:DKNYY domain-containing protein [Flavilitoribacter nigricans]